MAIVHVTKTARKCHPIRPIDIRITRCVLRWCDLGQEEYFGENGKENKIDVALISSKPGKIPKMHNFQNREKFFEKN